MTPALMSTAARAELQSLAPDTKDAVLAMLANQMMIVLELAENPVARQAARQTLEDFRTLFYTKGE